jgi:predicted aspartyl protease
MRTSKRYSPNALRRSLLTGAASSLALAPFVARSLSFTSAIADPPRGGETKDDPGDAIQTANGEPILLTVGVKLNGKGPFAFVVDTGADRTVIADDLVDAVGMSRGERVLVEGIIRSTPSDTALVSRMHFGSTERRDVWVPTLPRQMLKADGFLGLDVLDGRKITFDFKHHLLTVGAPGSLFAIAWNEQREERVRARGDSGHLRAVDCMVDGVRATAFIDSGAEVSACNSSLFSALMRRNARQSTSGTVALSGVTGGRIDGTLTSVDKVQLRELIWSDCDLVVADFEIFKIWGLEHTPALLIGMNLLRSCASVSIDYRRKELSFELTNSGAPQAPMYAGSGRRATLQHG